MAEAKGDCDFCGRERRTRFCEVCGVDYCSDCNETHDANHEFIVEAMELSE